MGANESPKWIADVLDKLPGAVGPVEREALAFEIAESFPVLECVQAATESLIAQFKRNGIAIADTEARAIAGNMLTAIGGAVMAPNTEATEYVCEFVEMSTLLGNIGAPSTVEGRRLRIADRLEILINTRRSGDATFARKLERLRAAHRAFWAAYQNGDVCDVHFPDEIDEPKDGEDRFRECPEDDTCECHGRAALNELQHAIDDIAGKIQP